MQKHDFEYIRVGDLIVGVYNTLSPSHVMSRKVVQPGSRHGRHDPFERCIDEITDFAGQRNPIAKWPFTTSIKGRRYARLSAVTV